VRIVAHGVEEREERRLPRRILDDSLRAIAAVVLSGIEMPGAARAEVERMPALAVVGQRLATAPST